MEDDTDISLHDKIQSRLVDILDMIKNGTDSLPEPEHEVRIYEEFLAVHRRKVSGSLNKVLWICIGAGPFIFIAVLAGLFKNVSIFAGPVISAILFAVALLHKKLIEKKFNVVFTSMLAFVAIDGLLVFMDNSHLAIYLTWFLIPLMSLFFCDCKIYFWSLGINYLFMITSVWLTAPYYVERRVDIETNLAYFLSRTGNFTRILWLSEDIDNEKRERDKLIDMSERAIAASEAKSSFLSNMSHEIRTPINAVLGMNEMILRECDDRNIIAYSESIKTAGNTLLSLVNDILDFSKIEAGKMEIIPVDYDLSSVINDLVNMIQTKVDDKGLKLELEISRTVPKQLHGDEVRIKQVITNILTNAVKYTEKGRVKFCIRYETIPE